MKVRTPSVALIWMYQGSNPQVRRCEIDEFDYPCFEVVEAGKDRSWSDAIRTISDDAEICVFWMDDEKPINRRFLKQMTEPLIASKELRAVMHFWSGNAMSVPRSMLEAFSLTQDDPAAVPSLLRLLVPVLDVAEPQRNGRVRIAFSSTEKLAPLSMEPVGSPS